jgi:hypothetical protein
MARTRWGACAARNVECERDIMRDPHPFDHHPSFRAAIAAAPPLAELVTRIGSSSLVGTLAVACSDLAEGFAAPPDSRQRLAAHRRAWGHIREIDRALANAPRNVRVSAEAFRRAQRAIDRADVLVSALIPS